MSTHRISIWAASLVFGVAIIAAPALAQTSLGTLRGKVTDEQGSVLPGATVTSRQIETNTARSSVTDALGQYFLPNLPPGAYELTVTHAGFAPLKQSNLVLRVGQEGTIDFVLKVASAQETITVSAQETLVETQHVVGTTIDAKKVDDLPTFNRSFADLALLAPGISTTGTSSMGFSAAGQHQFQNNVLVDGATNAMQFYGTQAESFPQDWIQEFQVMTNGFSAEFGNASGAVLNVVTRSGSNEFHGRAYGFFQNAALNSPPYAGRFVNGKPEFLTSAPEYNQYRIGGMLGGPLLKDKLFFFTGFENLDNSATASLSISEYWRNRGVQAVIPTGYTYRPFLIKGDWNVNDRHRVSARYDTTNQRLRNCSGQLGDGCNNQPLWTLEKRATFSGPIWSTVASLTSTLSDRTFNEARVHYGVNKVSIISNLAGKGGIALLQDVANRGLYSEKLYPGASFGPSNTGGLEGETNLYFSDNLTFVKGRHQFKIGGQLARVEFLMDIDASQKGRFGFTTDLAFDLNNPLSYPNNLTITLGSATHTESHWNYGLYFQDAWRVRQNLTLNLGLRYDVDNTITTGNELVDGYNQRFVAASGGAPPLNKVKRDLNNFAPRLGFVWVPSADRRTTIRGSGGLFYDQNHFNYNDIYINQTLLADARYVLNASDPTANPFYNPADPAGSRTRLRAFLAQNFPNFPDFSVVGRLPQSINGFDPKFRVPYTAQLTGGVTHQFGSKLFAQADYVYARGKDQFLQRNLNVQLVNGSFVNKDPRFSNYTLFQNLAWTQYHALQTRAEYRGDRWRAGVSYTLAKTTSSTSATGVGGGVATNPLDLSIDIGPASEDRRHNLSFDSLYSLPLGFQFSGIWRYSSALPWSVSSQLVVFARPEPRNSRRGDPYNSADLRVGKTFKLGERITAAGFWEVFNLFNTNNFTNYAGSLQSSRFGQPQSAFPKRQQQFGFRFDF